MMIETKTTARTFNIGNIVVGGPELTWILGPCLLESAEMAMQVAERVAEVSATSQRQIIFKGSFDKANRLSGESQRGPGRDEGLRILELVKAKTGLLTTTDIHTVDDAVAVSSVVDLIQIPAFLCRQTDLIVAAAQTQKPVNIKKGQFMAPSAMEHIAQKATGAGGGGVMLTERGTSFGYGDLVVDYRSLPIMRATGYPVCFDASHSVQSPGSAGQQSGGQRQYLLPLLRGALSVGVDAVFCEVHPNPDLALSDRQTQWRLDQIDELFENADRLEVPRRKSLELHDGS